jgi:hypothetical protein
MERHFFCTVFARDRKHLIALNQLDVDVFQPTARINNQKVHVIEGLLTLDEVAKLVDDGYQVLIEEDEAKRSRAKELITSADDWIKEFERR